jgi:hypothetical protein
MGMDYVLKNIHLFNGLEKFTWLKGHMWSFEEKHDYQFDFL